jgi:pimeloyl-ACP methyl ester carboxylesterase
VIARDVVFAEQAPLAANDMLMRRLLSPRGRERARARLAASQQTLAPYPLDSPAEHFIVYVPKHRPAQGYGLLVFVPPWQDARLPAGWAGVLDRAGVIFAAAARSGNDEPMVARRIPLALTAAAALQHRLPVDPARTYVGGFSGGARVAMRMALAYPDVFSGVLLNAGSDPVGEADTPLPASALTALLQNRTRFVFVTGADDATNQTKDSATGVSLARWCMTATATLSPPHMGHEALDGPSLSWALTALDRLAHADRARSEHCRAALQPKLDHARAEAAALHAAQRTAAGEAALDRLDAAYGGLIGGD